VSTTTRLSLVGSQLLQKIRQSVSAFYGFEAQHLPNLSLIYGKIAPIRLDSYGDVGIVVYDDRIGLAKDATLSAFYGFTAQSLPSLAKDATLSALYGLESQHLPRLQNLDTTLSSRASESTLSLIYGKITPLRFDAYGNLMVAVYGGAGGGAGGEVTIIGDTVGLARDATLQTLDSDLKSKLPRYLVDSAGNELSSYIKNIDTALSTLARLIRWGRDVTPTWVHGGEVTAPAAGTALVSKTVSSGKSGYIYGFFITAGEANDFKISWTSSGTTYTRRIIFGGKGSLQYADFVPLNEGLPADGGSTITITNVNAGSAGVIYQAAILYAEV